MLLLSGQLFAQQRNTTTLNLLNPTNPTSFVFTEAGYWEQTFNDEDYTFFTSQVYSFSHLIEGAGSSYGGYAWNGFTVCNSGDNSNHSGQWANYQWGNMAGGGIMTDAQGNILKDEHGDVLVQEKIPYLVGYWNYAIEPEWWELYGEWGFLDEPTRSLQILLDDKDEYEAVGVYVNIHPWTYHALVYGDALSNPFTHEGDVFKLIIHGLNADGTESGKCVEHIFAKFEAGHLTYNAKWEWVDLSTLGVIGGFYCTLASSDANDWGPLSPMYFCMDKLQVRTKSESIAKNELDNVQIYSNQNSIYIKSSETSLRSVEIFDLTGRLLNQTAINNTETMINLQAAPGIYFVKIISENNTTITRKITLMAR